MSILSVLVSSLSAFWNLRKTQSVGLSARCIGTRSHGPLERQLQHLAAWRGIPGTARGEEIRESSLRWRKRFATALRTQKVWWSPRPELLQERSASLVCSHQEA